MHAKRHSSLSFTTYLLWQTPVAEVYFYLRRQPTREGGQG